MSVLKIYPADTPSVCDTITEFTAIANALQGEGIRFERWAANQPLSDASTADAVLNAYRADVDRLMADNGFRTADVVSLTPAHPDKTALRNKFLAEHTHSEDEVRFFVDGSGLFYIHKGARVFSLLCEQGDLLSVPANTKHWFDMGAQPQFKCIRLFTNPDGWVAQFTGDSIAEGFPKLGE